MKIAIEKLRMDGGTQPRAEIDGAIVSEYSEAMQEGATFPPVTVFYDGADYWLADGFHRVNAEKAIGYKETEADVRQGNRRDAVLYSVGANQAHGLRRTNDDKRRAVRTLLEDAEWGKWSNSEISRRCGVHHTFVGRLKESLVLSTSEPTTYRTKHGTIATMNTSNIGRAAQAPEPEPVEEEESEQYEIEVESEETVLYEKEKTPLTAKEIRNLRPSEGVWQAKRAIRELGLIAENDTERQEAFDLVKGWIADHE
jgi:hypothetical protein